MPSRLAKPLAKPLALLALLALALVAACGGSQSAKRCECAGAGPTVTGGAPVDAESTEDADVRQLRSELAEARLELSAARSALVEAEARAARKPPRRPRRKRLDPDSIYAVPLGDAPWVGERDAKVTVVKGFEFACPFCERTRRTIDELEKRYQGDIKIVYKHFVVHAQLAIEPARAACAAARQGKFERYADLVWDKGFKNGRKLDRKHMEKLARRIKLDMARFRSDRDGACAETVRSDQAALQRLGMTGTPTFFINGRPLTGAQPLEKFTTLIDEELARANERIAADSAVTAANYYDRFVLAVGKKSLD